LSRRTYDTPKRHCTIKVRLTEEEKADFARACTMLGVTQSEAIRRAICGAAIKHVIVVENGGEDVLSQLSKLLTQCGHIGGNLNQIAKWLNQGGQLNDELRAEVRAALTELAAFRVNVQKAIGELYGHNKTYQLQKR